MYDKEPVPGRNDACWCGSGKKYKKCHSAFDERLERLWEEGWEVLPRTLYKTPADIEGIKRSAAINVGVLAYGLAVGAHRARQFGVGRHGAGGQVIVIASGLQLQQLEMFACREHVRVDVAQDHVSIGDLLARGGVGARVDKVLARSARLKNCTMTVVDGQQNQDVHKQSSPLDLPKGAGLFWQVLSGKTL